MATTQQSYTRATVTSTGTVSVAFGFIAKYYRVENLSTSLSLYCEFGGGTASSASYPLRAGQLIELRNTPSSVIDLANVSTAASIAADVLGLQ